MLGGSAGKGVDRLAGIAHNAQFVPPAQPQFQEALLQRRNVLVLVHHKMPVLLADGGRDFLVLLQDPHRDQEYVLKINDVAVGFDVLIGLEDPGDGGEVEPAGGSPPLRILQVVCRGQHGNLGPLDFRGEVPDGRAVRAEPQAAGRFGDHLGLVVQQVWQGAAYRLWPEKLQLPQGSRVEGARLHVAHAEVPQPAAHLRCGPRRERHGEEPLGTVNA